jgi:hypothetical protein
VSAVKKLCRVSLHKILYFHMFNIQINFNYVLVQKKKSYQCILNCMIGCYFCNSSIFIYLCNYRINKGCCIQKKSLLFHLSTQSPQRQHRSGAAARSPLVIEASLTPSSSSRRRSDATSRGLGFARPPLTGHKPAAPPRPGNN